MPTGNKTFNVIGSRGMAKCCNNARVDSLKKLKYLKAKSNPRFVNRLRIRNRFFLAFVTDLCICIPAM